MKIRLNGPNNGGFLRISCVYHTSYDTVIHTQYVLSGVSSIGILIVLSLRLGIFSTMKNKLKIGVFGSAVTEGTQAMNHAISFGSALGAYKDEVILVTGACPGVPYAAATAAHKNNVEVWGFSPAHSHDEHDKLYPNSNGIYKQMEYVPRKFSLSHDIMARCHYRCVTLTHAVDAGIIIAGRWGTMNEFTNLADFGKVVGVLKGTGGIADTLEHSVSLIQKDRGATILFDTDPISLAQRVFETAKMMHGRTYTYHFE